ncbi:unnamed protein product [Peniophora sp. CBMAI 1063]|nr:unnamed protein product [Peniophora sp. CBMAI 1063]
MAKRKRRVIVEAGSDDATPATAAPTTTTDTSFVVPAGSTRAHVEVTRTENDTEHSNDDEHSDDGEDDPFYATTWALHAQAAAHAEVQQGTDAQQGTDNQATPASASPAPASSAPPRATKKARQKSNKNVHGILDWRDEEREHYADEKMRHEGLGVHRSLPPCRLCFKRLGNTWCTHCTGLKFICEGCLVSKHHENPTHTVKRWCPQKKFFDVYTLAEAGLVIQLGHDGLSCPNPRPRQGLLTVLDVLTVASVRVNYCACGTLDSNAKVTQLLRVCWWPATNVEPRTVLTFSLLEHYYSLNATGRTNMYDYYTALHRLTDNTGTRPPKYRYKEFARAVRCYQNLRNGCLAGRAHDPDGFAGLSSQGQPPSVIVECPLCPRMGENTPDPATIPEEMWHYYSFKIAIDGNFKAKLKNRNLLDVPLQDGWSYFAPNAPYTEHFKKYGHEPEAKYCDSNFAAVDHAQTPSQKRFSVNGIVSCVCSRHGYYLRHCTGDLKFGEQFSPIDFLVLSVLGIYAHDIDEILITYDIACSYSVNFPTRMERYPEHLRIDLSSMHIVWAVPKFHLRGHGPRCRGWLNLAYTRWVGRTHGEIVEAGWAELNSVALSSREMAFFSRHETLENVMSNINWHKTVRNCTLLVINFNDAILYRTKQGTILGELDGVFPEDLRSGWMQQVRTWEAKLTNKNPYEEKEMPTSMNDVKLALQHEEAEEVKKGILPPHETSGSVFIMVGLELEEQQRSISATAAKKSNALTDKVSLREKRNKLQHRIDSWRRLQDVYMPFVSRLLSEHSHTTSDDEWLYPERAPLFLPSSLSDAQRAMCLGDIAAKEERLRVAQALDAIHHVRRCLRVKLGLVHYKHVQAEGPSNARTSRARSLIADHESKLNRHVERYRATRAALLLLSPDGEWTAQLRELKRTDLRLPGADDVGDNPEEDRRRARQTRQRLLQDEATAQAGSSDISPSSHTIPDPSSPPSLSTPSNAAAPSLTQLRKLQSSGRAEMSWIWRTIAHTVADMPVGDDSVTQEEVDECMRVEYIIQHARVDRWREEVNQLEVEMDSGVRHFDHRARWWLSRCGSRRHQVTSDIASGLDAYARRQADTANRMANMYVKHWQPCLRKHGRVDLWANRCGDALWDSQELPESADGATPTALDHDRSVSSDESDTDSENARPVEVSNRIAGIERGDDEAEDGDSGESDA